MEVRNITKAANFRSFLHLGYKDRISFFVDSAF